jgi:DNA polymerase-3 subunit delta'
MEFVSWELIGHEWASSMLAQHIRKGSVRHAYLITGPANVGRRSLAIRFAQALNCITPVQPGYPCCSCTTCKRIERMVYPDLTIVAAEQVGGVLQVEAIRELIHTLALAPYEAGYRIALLLRFEEAHPSAQNALLKTLEEPNPKVILFLTAESPQSVLPTIVSRCEVIRLRPVAVEELQKGLINTRNIPLEQAQLFAHLSGGRPGYALRLLEEPELLDQHRTWIEEIWRLVKTNRVERFGYIQSLTKEFNKETIRSMLLVWSSFWHDVLLRCSGARTSPTNFDWYQEIEQLASGLELSTAREFVNSIEITLLRIKKNVNPRLALEVLMLDLPHLQVK